MGRLRNPGRYDGVVEVDGMAKGWYGCFASPKQIIDRIIGSPQMKMQIPKGSPGSPL